MSEPITSRRIMIDPYDLSFLAEEGSPPRPALRVVPESAPRVEERAEARERSVVRVAPRMGA